MSRVRVMPSRCAADIVLEFRYASAALRHVSASTGASNLSSRSFASARKPEAALRIFPLSAACGNGIGEFVMKMIATADPFDGRLSPRAVIAREGFVFGIKASIGHGNLFLVRGAKCVNSRFHGDGVDFAGYCPGVDTLHSLHNGAQRLNNSPIKSNVLYIKILFDVHTRLGSCPG